MSHDELIQEVERDFNTLTDFARVCGLTPELIDCMLRLQLKVRGLYGTRKVRTYRPKRVRETFEPIHIEADTRWE